MKQNIGITMMMTTEETIMVKILLLTKVVIISWKIKIKNIKLLKT